MEFKPNKVDRDSWRLWLKEGVILSFRKPLHFMFISSMLCALHYLPIPLSVIFFLSMPIALAAGCIVAECANESLNVWRVVSAKPALIWFRLLVVICSPWVFIAITLMIILLFTQNNEHMVYGKAQAISSFFEPGVRVSVGMFIWFSIMGFLLWFVVPLLVIAETPLIEAIEQTFDALYINSFVYKIIVVLALCSLLGVFIPILVFPWCAIVSSMMFISYRHIWLGKGLNEPKKVLSVLDPNLGTCPVK